MHLHDSYTALQGGDEADRGSQALTGGDDGIKGSLVMKKALRESAGASLSPSLTPMMSRTPNDRERADIGVADLVQPRK